LSRQTRFAVSNANGEYSLAGLDAGEYVVEASLSGFTASTATISLAPGQDRVLEFTLGLARFSEQIVVTALKHGEQRLIDTPLAVTAVGGEELETLGAQSILDVIQTAPGATAYEAGPGVNVPQIRGISATSGDSPIGYYLDEMPFAMVGTYIAPDVSMFDLERTEILRGPQGTLYGDGALGGVIRFLTRNPDLEAYQVKGDLTLSSYSGGGNNYTTNAAVSVPIVKDRFAIRATASYRSLGGWVDSPIFGHDINKQTYETYRVKALLQPTERLRATVSAWFNRTSADATNDANDDGVIESPIPQPTNTWFDVYSGVIEYDASSFKLLSASSYMKEEWNSTVGVLFAPGLTFPLVSTFGVKSFSQEIRLASKGSSRFKWTAGGFYRNAESPTKFDLGGLLSDTLSKSDSWALFGEGTYTPPGDRVDITFGVRYFEDKRTTNDSINMIGGKADFQAFSPRLNVAFRPAHGALVYVNVAKGFRSGLVQYPFSVVFARILGLEIPPMIDPENAWTYELGTKLELAPGLGMEGALYYTDYRDLQTLLPIAGQPVFAFYNVGSAHIPGVDWVIRAQPAQGLSLSFGGNWNQAEYAEDIVVNGSLVVKKGQRISNVPKVSLNASARYSRPVGRRGLAGFGDVGAQYSSERFQAGTTADTTNNSDKILTVQVRAGVLGAFGEIALFVNNATNDRGAIAPPFSANRYGQARLAPREAGINFKFALHP
jgi:outer membrane receptor protein involved in Fe transport